MRFSFGPERADLKRRAADFALQHIEPARTVLETTDRPPAGLLREIGRQGFMRVRLPGSPEPGLDHLDQVIVMEAFSYHSAAVGLLMVAQLMGTATVLEFGGPAVQERYLPLLMEGELFIGLGITEPAGGTLTGNPATFAERDGDAWILTGRKVFITGSHLAGLALVVARTSPDPRRGLSVFVVDMASPGFRLGRAEHKAGLAGCVTGELVMDRVRVPAENMLAEEGEGQSIALKAISEYGRKGNAAVDLGVMQAIYDETRDLAAAAGQLADPAVQESLAMIYAESHAAQLLTYRAAWLLDTGARADAEVATTKFYANDASLRCIQRAMTIAGNLGLAAGHPLEGLFRDCIPLIAADGTGDIQRVVAARSLVGRFSW